MDASHQSTQPSHSWDSNTTIFKNLNAFINIILLQCSMLMRNYNKIKKAQKITRLYPLPTAASQRAQRASRRSQRVEERTSKSSKSSWPSSKDIWTVKWTKNNGSKPPRKLASQRNNSRSSFGTKRRNKMTPRELRDSSTQELCSKSPTWELAKTSLQAWWRSWAANHCLLLRKFKGRDAEHSTGRISNP